MKFIHCADLHLDSKLEANLSKEKIKQRKNELLLSFGRMVNFANDNQINIIVIAGDMFDRETVSSKVKNYVIETIKDNKEIDFLYLSGNHDRNLTAFFDCIPENLKIFKDKWTSFVYENVVFSGVELTDINNKTVYDSLVLNENQYNVVVMHGQESSVYGIDNIKLSSLKNKNIDYLALGHIHKNSTNKLDNRGIYAYCGCLEGRGFDECGKKGFYIVDTDRNSIDFQSVTARELSAVEVDISNLKTSVSIFNKINEKLKNIPLENMIKVVLTGTYTIETEKDIDFFLSVLNEKYFFVKIKDQTQMKIDEKDYINDISLKAEFIRQVVDSELSSEERGLVISYGLKALKGESIE